MRFGFRLNIPPRWIAALFGVAGVVLASVSVRKAHQRVTALKTWPHVEARVRGGGVGSMSSRGRREAMYAARLQLEYEFRGRRYTVPATEEVYSSSYAEQARGVRQAVRAGRVSVLLDPNRPAAPVLNAGYNAEFFFGSLVPGWIGVVFVFLATTLWRTFRPEVPGAVARSRAASGGWIIAFFIVMGVAFTAGGGFAFYLAQRQLRTWKPVEARVDSTDVVWRSGRSGGTGSSANGGSSPVDLYAPRAWLTYTFHDAVYRAPAVRGAYSNDSSGAARAADLLWRAGTISARVDPNNPFDATVARRSAARALWFPALFSIPGLVCLVLAVVLGSRTRRRRRRAA